MQGPLGVNQEHDMNLAFLAAQVWDPGTRGEAPL